MAPSFYTGYNEIKNGVYKIRIHHPQFLVKAIVQVVDYSKSGENSEHCHTKLVVLESTETIVAETFLDKRQSNRFCKELSFLAMILTFLKINFQPEKKNFPGQFLSVH